MIGLSRRPFLVLLPTRMQVARVHNGERVAPFSCLPGFRSAIGRTTSRRLRVLAPGTHDANRGTALDFHQMTNANIIEHGVRSERCAVANATSGAESFVHRGCLQSSRDVVDTQDRCWQQSNGGEDRESPLTPSVYIKYLGTAERFA